MCSFVDPLRCVCISLTSSLFMKPPQKC
jgi:hypothetical protein